MHLPYRFCTVENAVCRPHSTVHLFNHLITLLWTSEFTHVSPVSSMVAKDHFSWCTFLNVWKRLLFARDNFAGAQSNRLGHTFRLHETFYKWRPDSNLFSSQLHGNFGQTASASCLLHTRRALPRLNLHYFCLSRMRNVSKVTSVSSGTNASDTLGKNQKGSVCCCFSWMTESETFGRLSVFPECAIDFHDF